MITRTLIAGFDVIFVWLWIFKIKI